MRSLFRLIVLIFTLSQLFLATSARVEVISTTCQTQEKYGSELKWMTCDGHGSFSPPKTFREFEHYKNSKEEDRKFCCSSITTRFCCTFDEKKKELPDFDPNTHEDPEFSYLYRSDWHHFGFWNGLLVTATIVLILGLMIYMISCIFVEVFEMIIYVLCYCCRKKKKGKTNTKEYRPNERNSLVNGVDPLSTSPSRRTFNIGDSNRNAYQTIDGQNYIVRSSPNGGQPNLYQNVTDSVRPKPLRPVDAPPAYDQLA